MHAKRLRRYCWFGVFLLGTLCISVCNTSVMPISISDGVPSQALRVWVLRRYRLLTLVGPLVGQLIEPCLAIAVCVSSISVYIFMHIKALVDGPTNG